MKLRILVSDFVVDVVGMVDVVDMVGAVDVVDVAGF